MKITKQALKRIITEEIKRALKETVESDEFDKTHNVQPGRHSYHGGAEQGAENEVHVLSRGREHEARTVVGVYSSEERARAAKKTDIKWFRDKSYTVPMDEEYEIEKFKLDDTNSETPI